MAIVLAYWLFLFFLTLPYGILSAGILKLEIKNALLFPVLGMFFLAVAYSIIAFFFPLNTIVFIITSVSASTLYFLQNSKLKAAIGALKKSLLTLPATTKFIILIVLAAVSLKFSIPPQLIDNYSYYTQSIKWINEYGFVKGLANLHLFFGQASPWHVLQAGLNFSFLTNRINDINGFIFILGILYYFTESVKDKNSWIGFMPFFSLLFFPFLDAPSPDLPLLVLTPVILNLFLEENYKVSYILFLFVAFIKITIAPLGVIFLMLFLKNRNNILLFTSGFIITGSIWIIKNIIITGYPIFPLTTLSVNTDWKIPQEIITSIGGISNSFVYNAPVNASWTRKILNWFLTPGIDGFFNKTAVILFIVMPCISNFRKNKNLMLIYVALLFQFILLLFASPQFRFFLPTVLFFSVYILHVLFSGTLLKYRDITITLGSIGCIFAFTGLLPENNIIKNSNQFSLSYLIAPEKNHGNEKINFIKTAIGNLNYYSPEKDFIYYTGNGPLPCLNKKQLDYIKQKTGYIPQLRNEQTDNPLNGGFISVKK